MFLSCLIFLLCFGLFLFCSLCLLEWSKCCSLCLLAWSRCCSCFVVLGFVLFVLSFVFLCVCFFRFLMEITVAPAILAFFWSNVHSISVSHFKFCFFCFVCFLFPDVPLFVFICLSSCFVMNQNIRFAFVCIFISCFILLFFGFGILDFWLPIKNISRKFGNSEGPKIKMQQENGHFDKSN